MTESRVEAALHKLDERVERIEQILPTLATRDDLKGFPTQNDPKGFATKDDLKTFATRDDVREEGERTRRHFDAVAEEFLSQVKLVSEGTAFLSERVDRELGDVRSTVRALDRRVIRLEAGKTRP